jgi:hypothetical protein
VDHLADRVGVGEDDLRDLRRAHRLGGEQDDLGLRQVTTEPESRRTIRSSRSPSSLVISRSTTLAAIVAPDRRLRSEGHFGGGSSEPGYGNRQTLVVTPLGRQIKELEGRTEALENVNRKREERWWWWVERIWWRLLVAGFTTYIVLAATAHH